MQKNNQFYLSSFIYRQISDVKLHPIGYLLIIGVHVAIYIISLLRYITDKDNPFKTDQNIAPVLVNEKVIFYFLVGYTIFMILLSLICVLVKNISLIVKTIWVYGLFILEAFSQLYIFSGVRVFQTGSWSESENNIQLKIGIIVLLIVLILGIFLKNKVYYPFHSVENLLSMRQQNITIWLFIYRVCSGIIKNHIISIGSSYQFIGVAVLTVFLFWKSRNTGYLNPFTKKIWGCFYTIIMWTEICLYAVMHLQKDLVQLDSTPLQTEFSILEIYLQIWGSTLPFVLLIPIFQRRDIKKDSWMTIFSSSSHSLEKQLSSSYIFLLCNQFHHKLKEIKQSDLKYRGPQYKKLWVVISKHWQTCSEINCPLNQLKTMANIENIQDEFLANKKYNKVLTATLDHCRNIYRGIIYDNPKKLDQKIELASFELLALLYKQDGMLLYTQNIHLDKVPDDIKFSIYFLKRKIDDMFVGIKKLAEEIANQQISEFRHKLQVSVAKLSDFWYFLSEPKCNLKSLYNLANQLFPLKIGVEKDWERIKYFKNVTSYNLYARYLIKMFNDKEKGFEIMEEIKKIQYQNKMKKQIELGDKTTDIIQQHGIIFLEFDGKNSGVIFQANVNAQKLFCHMKGELLNQKVNDIMPSIYSKHHDRILQNYQQTNESNMMNKQRHIWGKAKDGFIFPMVILIKPIHSVYSESSTSEVYASIRREIHMKQIAGIILNVDKQVTDISSSAIRIFPKLKKFNSRQKIKIQQIIPQFDQFRLKILKQNQSCELKVSRKPINNTQSLEDQVIEQCLYSIEISDVKIQVSGHIGYIIKLVKISHSDYFLPKTNNEQKTTEVNQGIKMKFAIQVIQQDIQRNRKPSQRSIKKNDKYNNINSSKLNSSEAKGLSKMKYIGVFEQSSAAFIKLLDNTVSNFKASLKVEEQLEELQKIDYAIGIKIKRLVDGHIREMREDEEISYGKKQQDRDENSGIDQFEAVKPSQISDMLAKKQGNPLIKTSKILTFVLLLVCSLIAITEFLVMRNLSISIYQNMGNIKTLNELACEVLAIKFYSIYFSRYSANNSILISGETYEYLPNNLPLSTFGNWQNSFAENIRELDTDMNSFVFTQEATVTYRDNFKDQYYLGFALNKLISETNTIKNFNLQSPNLLSKTNTNGFFIMYNTVNGLLIGLQDEIKYHMDDIEMSTNVIQKARLIFLIVGGVFAAIIILIKNILFRKAINKKSEILQIFFEIPRKSCSLLNKECQKFILKLSTDQDVQADSDIEDDNPFDNKNNSKRKRTITGEQRFSLIFSLISIVFLVFLLIYFGYNLIENIHLDQKLQKLYQGSIHTYSVQKKWSIFSNFMDSYIDDRSFPINNSMNHLDMIQLSNNQAILCTELFKLKHFDISQFLNSEFINLNSQYFYQNYCEPPASIQQCQKILLLDPNGYNSVLNSYKDYLMIKYAQLMASGPSSLSEQQLSQQFIYRQSLKQIARKTSDHLQSSMKIYFDQIQMKFLFFLIAVCVVNILVLWLAWYKYYNNIQSNIEATQYILTFIPGNQIAQNSRISTYLRQNYFRK